MNFDFRLAATVNEGGLKRQTLPEAPTAQDVQVRAYKAANISLRLDAWRDGAWAHDDVLDFPTERAPHETQRATFETPKRAVDEQAVVQEVIGAVLLKRQAIHRAA